MTALSAKPRVFTSYAHEGDLGDKVKALADQLLEQGVEVIADHPCVNHPSEKGGHAWIQPIVNDALKNEENDLGRANTLQALGDVCLKKTDFEQALGFYEEALPLYRSEQEPMGWAYTLAEIIRCCHGLKTLDRLADLTKEALTQAKASGVESVTDYVLEALLEACDRDEEKWEALSKRL